MALSERSRQEMYTAFEKQVGKEAALTLMEHLPPVGWADVATKQDLEILELRLTADIDNKLKNQFIAIVTTNAVVVGLLLTIFKFGH